MQVAPIAFMIAVRAADPRKLFPHLVAENFTRGVRLLDTLRRNVGMQLGQQDLARYRMRNEDGTMPLAWPECTPSERISTVSVPPTRPRSDVVTHS